VKKKKEEQLCLFHPSYEELVSWDGMQTISPYRLKTLMGKFFIKNSKKKKGSKHMNMKHYAWAMAINVGCLLLSGCHTIEGEKIEFLITDDIDAGQPQEEQEWISL
jgi:hypothetical protein